MVLDATICHIIREKKVLLKKATRGISVGKWNGPGGKIEPGETPEQNVVREVREETGLEVAHPFFHGTIEFYMKGGNALDIRVYVFSSRDARGRPRSTEEGPVKWFDAQRLPFDEMWDDDRYWVNPILLGMRFDAKFHYDEGNRKVVKFEMRSRPRRGALRAVLTGGSRRP